MVPVQVCRDGRGQELHEPPGPPHLPHRRLLQQGLRVRRVAPRLDELLGELARAGVEGEGQLEEVQVLEQLPRGVLGRDRDGLHRGDGRLHRGDQLGRDVKHWPGWDGERVGRAFVPALDAQGDEVPHSGWRAAQRINDQHPAQGAVSRSAVGLWAYQLSSSAVCQ